MPGGKLHWGPGFEFGSRGPGSVAGLFDVETQLLPPLDGLNEGAFGPQDVGHFSHCYLLSTALVFPEEGGMMQQSSVSISLSF